MQPWLLMVAGWLISFIIIVIYFIGWLSALHSDSLMLFLSPPPHYSPPQVAAAAVALWVPMPRMLTVMCLSCRPGCASPTLMLLALVWLGTSLW